MNTSNVLNSVSFGIFANRIRSVHDRVIHVSIACLNKRERTRRTVCEQLALFLFQLLFVQSARVEKALSGRVVLAAQLVDFRIVYGIVNELDWYQVGRSSRGRGEGIVWRNARITHR